MKTILSSSKLRNITKTVAVILLAAFIGLSGASYADDFENVDIANEIENAEIEQNTELIDENVDNEDVNVFFDVSENDLNSDSSSDDLDDTNVGSGNIDDIAVNEIDEENTESSTEDTNNITLENNSDISGNEQISNVSDVSSDDIDFADTFVEQTFTEEVGDCIITISGNLPKGLTYTIEEITDLSQYESLISASTNKNVILQKLFDINLFYENEIFEPEDYGTFVTITINNLNDSDLSVYKIDEEKNIESIDSTKQDDILSFNADHFTLYGVGQTLGSGNGLTAILKSGKLFNWEIRKLTDPNEVEFDGDDIITAIKYSDVPFSDGEGVVHLEKSGTPVLARLNGTIVEIYSEADTIYANSNCSCMFGSRSYSGNGERIYAFYNLETLDVSWINTSNVTDMSYMFSNCDLLTSLDLSNWDTSNVTNMTYMFDHCLSLTYLNLNNWETSNVSDTKYMFEQCYSLASIDIDHFDTSSVTDMQHMFNMCRALTELNLNNWDVSNVIYMQNIFSGCISLTTLDISDWDVTNVKSLASMFYNCEKLTTINISSWETPKLTDISSMFSNCYSLTDLDVSNFNVSNVIYMQSVFSNCRSLVTLDVSNWNTSNVTHMGGLFSGCISLTTLDVSDWNTSNVIYITGAFNDCEALTVLDLSGWNVAITSPIIGAKTSYNGVRGYIWPIYNCKKITEIDLSGWDLSGISTIPELPLNLYNENLKKITVPKNIPEDQSIWIGYGSSSYSWYKDDDGDLMADSKEKYTYISSSMLNGTSHTFIRSDIDGFSLPTIKTTLKPGQEINGLLQDVKNLIYMIRYAQTPFTSDLELQVEDNEPVYGRVVDIDGYQPFGTPQYAHTNNINNSGVNTSPYDNNLNVNTTITIPDAERLEIHIKYATESLSYDWVSIIQGTYTGSAVNSKTAPGVVKTLAGGRDTINEETLIVEGNTVTFSFRSDSDVNYYGYYAVVTGQKTLESDLKILEIYSEADVIQANSNCYRMFAGLEQLEIVDFSWLDFNKTTSSSSVFVNCDSLKTVTNLNPCTTTLGFPYAFVIDDDGNGSRDSSFINDTAVKNEEHTYIKYVPQVATLQSSSDFKATLQNAGIDISQINCIIISSASVDLSNDVIQTVNLQMPNTPEIKGELINDDNLGMVLAITCNIADEFWFNEDCAYMFDGFTNLNFLSINDFIFSETTNTTHFIDQCDKLKDISINSFFVNKETHSPVFNKTIALPNVTPWITLDILMSFSSTEVNIDNFVYSITFNEDFLEKTGNLRMPVYYHRVSPDYTITVPQKVKIIDNKIDIDAYLNFAKDTEYSAYNNISVNVPDYGIQLFFAPTLEINGKTFNVSYDYSGVQFIVSNENVTLKSHITGTVTGINDISEIAGEYTGILNFDIIVAPLDSEKISERMKPGLPMAPTESTS